MFDYTKTQRGFELLVFSDDYNQSCSIQQSSSVEPRIWLGVNDPNPKIMKSQAKQYGLQLPPGEVSGWMPYPIPEDVLLSTRMHLNREQTIALIGKLQRWVDSGELK